MKNVQTHLEKAIEINPEYVDAHYELSLILMDKGEYGLAKDHLLKVIKIDPSYMEAHFHLALLFKEIKENKKSKEFFMKAIELDPNFADSYYHYGLLLSSMEDYEDAKNNFEKASDLDQNHFNSYFHLAKLLIDPEDYEKAKKNYLIAIDINQDFTEAYYCLGKLVSLGLQNDENGTLIKKPEYDIAIIHLKKAIQRLLRLDIAGSDLILVIANIREHLAKQGKCLILLLEDFTAFQGIEDKILEALIARGISGRGRHIEVSLFDALADWMAVPLLWQDYGGKAPERVGLSHPSICPYGAFKTADGKTLLLSIQNEREWIRFCADILDDADFADQYPDNSSRLSNRSVVDKRVAAVLGKMLHAEIAAKLKKSEIAYGTLNDMQGFSTHPVLRRVEISNPEGSIRFPAPPAIFNNKLTETLGDVPELNQHGEAIRAEFAKTSPKD